MATFNPELIPELGEIHPEGIFATNKVTAEAAITKEQDGKPGSGGRSMFVIMVRTDLGEGREGFLTDRMVFTETTTPSDFAMSKMLGFCKATGSVALLANKDLADLEVLNEFALQINSLEVKPSIKVRHSKRKSDGEKQANVSQYISSEVSTNVKIEETPRPAKLVKTTYGK